MRFLRSRRRVFLLLAVILLALFLYRPGANGLRKRIAGSVGLALGRRVEVDWVKLRLIPPGFDLENFVVYDDPSFSAEPMLRAQEVTAVLRLRSLLRGRLEVGRLNLTEPSLNLVRGENGHWNLESLLERAAHTPAAPTRNTSPQARPVFPYIEADNGRINFKIGQEKKAYALTGADFALWLESENEWGMRLVAQPVRTDFNLSDTGTVRVNGTWQRSGSLRETPLRFALQWDRAQLGQVTKLIYGKDKGWRGGLTLSTTFSGTPADLSVAAQASVEDFRRYDIVSSPALRLGAACTAHYSSVDHLLSLIVCQAPVGKGTLTLAGSVTAPSGPSGYDLGLVAEDLPIQSLVALARRAKRDLPEDLTASGTLDASLSVRTPAKPGEPAAEWQGDGQTTDFRLRSDATKTELVLGKIPFVLAVERATPGQRRSGVAGHRIAEAHLDIGPFALTSGKSSSTTVHGWVSRSGYNLAVQGDAQVQRLLQIAQIVGLRALPPVADGTARVNLQIAGAWSGFAAPTINGTAQLHSVRAELRGLNRPIDIVSANLLLSNDAVQVKNLSASAADTHWRGSLTLPRQCSASASCPVRFDLQADSILTDRLHEWLTPHPRKRPWYRLLSPALQQGPSLLATLNASGEISANRAVIRGLVASRVSAHLELQEGKAKLTGLQGEFLGGEHQGDWEADFRATPPSYTGGGTFARASLGQMADAMHDSWITGTANVNYHLAASGNTTQELLASATGTVQFDVREGTLPHIALTAGNAPLRIRHFTGRMSLKDAAFQMQEGKLETPAGIYQVSGTAFLNRKLDLRLARDSAHGFAVTGILSAPHVSQANAPETRAALKP